MDCKTVRQSMEIRFCCFISLGPCIRVSTGVSTSNGKQSFQQQLQLCLHSWCYQPANEQFNHWRVIKVSELIPTIHPPIFCQQSETGMGEEGARRAYWNGSRSAGTDCAPTRDLEGRRIRLYPWSDHFILHGKPGTRTLGRDSSKRFGLKTDTAQWLQRPQNCCSALKLCR